MSFIGEEAIKEKIAEINSNLSSNNLGVLLVADSLRDYQAQICVSKEGQVIGRAIIYYSPKKDSYKLRPLQDLSGETLQVLEAALKGEHDSATLTAYVDGSFIDGTAAYGAVILKNEQVLTEISGTLPASEAVYHQVGGELKAALQVLEYAEKNGYKQITICYDYEGVEKFATKAWQAESSLARRYQEEIKKYSIAITWVKVAAHTGVIWNERADELAKEAAKKAPNVKVLPQAENLAKKFTKYLEILGYEIENQGLKNGQYIRLVVRKNNQVFFDLYDTKNRPLIPYIHGSDKEAVKLIDRHWLEFKKQSES